MRINKSCYIGCCNERNDYKYRMHMSRNGRHNVSRDCKYMR